MNDPEKLIEAYLQALEDFDELKMAEINKKLKKIKPIISADVRWHNGKVSNLSGELLNLKEAEVFFQTSFGDAAGNARTMEFESIE